MDRKTIDSIGARLRQDLPGTARLPEMMQQALDELRNAAHVKTTEPGGLALPEERTVALPPAGIIRNRRPEPVT